MANPKLIKKRVTSINNIKKITKALEMVSASKVQKAQTAALNAKPYARLIYELVNSLSGDIKLTEIPLMRVPDKSTSDLYIIVSTNRGLAGSLNTNLFKFFTIQLAKLSGRDNSFVTVGKKGRSFAVSSGRLLADFSEDKDLGSVVSAVTRLITDGFVDGEFGAVYIAYSEFINALKQEPRVKQLLPILKSTLLEEGEEHFDLYGKSAHLSSDSTSDLRYSYEPDPVEVLRMLLPFYLEIQVAESIYESSASEHSARMIAMKNATENATELSASLSLEYNKARQTLITGELSDITTALVSLPSHYE